jgi:hypothetical protein
LFCCVDLQYYYIIGCIKSTFVFYHLYHYYLIAPRIPLGQGRIIAKYRGNIV